MNDESGVHRDAEIALRFLDQVSMSVPADARFLLEQMNFIPAAQKVSGCHAGDQVIKRVGESLETNIRLPSLLGTRSAQYLHVQHGSADKRTAYPFKVLIVSRGESHVKDN